MQAQPEQLTLGEASDRLDRLPASRFHAKILIVAALSLLASNTLRAFLSVLLSRDAPRR
jgi:hypothetical protein